MRRETSPPRRDMAEQFEALNFSYASTEGNVYWDESARYVFSMREIEHDLEAATIELSTLCLELVSRVCDSEELMERLRLPRLAFDVIRDSWKKRELSLYGRFDFAYAGDGPPKLLEYNADTPTGLYEAAVVQWYWLEQLIEGKDLPTGTDQFNSLHEKLVARWRLLAYPRDRLHFACMTQSFEDVGNVAYLAECAKMAGFLPIIIDIRQIGVGDWEYFIDDSLRPIETLFKLYPWEWMFADTFGGSIARKSTRFIEPPWKAILSNKGALALLWEMAPGHPNLLPCHFENDARAAVLGDNYARKPIYSREGANVSLIRRGETIASEAGSYGAEGFVRQALHMSRSFDARYPVLGCWLIGDEPAGMGVREDVSPITSNRSRFVPHVILD